jgi:RND family efflux transporter MFP subunit
MLNQEPTNVICMHKIGLVICLVSCLLLFSCKHAQPPPSTVVPVNLLTVTTEPVIYYEKYPSTTVALKQVDLLPEVQGYITGMFFKEGSHVKKGQRLYEIDRRTYEANYSIAVANLKVAEGNVEQTKQDADRYTYLNNNHAVAKQLYDHAIIAFKNAQNSAQAAAESVKTARVNLNFSEIIAPFDGTIGFSQVKLGNLVSVGQTVLNTVSTDNPMGVDFLINEKQLAHFRDLQNGTAKPIDSLFTLLLPNNNLYARQGQISVLDRAVNPQTGAMRVRLTFPNSDYSLRPGMSCVVRVHNQDAAAQIVIPYKAIVEQMGEYFVYVAKDTSMPVGGKQKKEPPPVKQGLFALQKKVKLGEVIEPNVVIKSGIRKGDKIVVDGVQTLHDGSQITTENKRPPEQGKAR